MSRPGVPPARLILEALRLDRWPADRVLARAGAALDLGVGGFLLFGGEAEAVARLTSTLRERAGRPLWFAADLERGAGQQFRGLTELPPPAALARAPDPAAAAERAGAITGAEGRSVGVNWVLAPVVDLDVEEANPIVATRSFGADPDVVTALAARWIAGCRRSGALACAKHFPGHGRTVADSHMELPVVTADAALLESDMAPFRALAGEAGAVMVAHVAYPALGCNGPATRDAGIVRERLRRRWRFEGLIATDAMIMAGAGPDQERAAVEAVRAGCDLVLYPADAERVAASLADAARDDRRLARAIAEAAARSARWLEHAGSVAPEDAGGGGFEDLEFAIRTLVARGVETEAWQVDAPTEVVALSDDPDLGPPAGRAGPLGTPLVTALRSAGWNVRPEPVDPGTPSGATQRIVLLASTPRGWKGRGRLSADLAERVRAALAGADRPLLFVFGHLRVLDAIGTPGVCAWSTETLMERAAAEWLRRRVGGGA